MTVKAISTKRIGDGKLPNRYWVSIFNDYYYYNKENEVFDWISEKEMFEVKAKTIQVFNTYQAAKEFAENELCLGITEDGFTVNGITIEDRLSGKVYSHIRHYSPEDGKIDDDFTTEDLRFTQEKMAKLNQHFS